MTTTVRSPFLSAPNVPTFYNISNHERASEYWPEHSCGHSCHYLTPYMFIRQDLVLGCRDPVPSDMGM